MAAEDQGRLSGRGGQSADDDMDAKDPARAGADACQRSGTHDHPVRGRRSSHALPNM